MAANIATLLPYLQNFDFPGLMVEELGWNHLQSASIVVSVGNDNYDLSPIAEKAGFAVYRCSPGADGATPNQNIRRQIERKVADTSYEHLLIFADDEETSQVWQWVKRESGKPAALRELRYDQGQTGTALLQRLRGIEFTLAEEGKLRITDVTDRFRGALDVDRVTNAFYKRFHTELTTFQKFINGFTSQGDRDWYASLMLNRMMFVYFIQKQAFLDQDEHYLRNRLRQVREQEGSDRFQGFYRQFLLRLFHEGLGQPEAERPAELVAQLGKVPYLNGGIFDPHTLETGNPDINIPDAAFEQIFAFFDQYQWHLDDRPSGADNEINPDVLGYIFEKYVNQKQMGAYYTKEDITGYIARNTVIPRLLEMAHQECPIAFGPGGGVWRLLQDDPDNYIYPAVGHGIAWDYSPESLVRLEEPLELPEHIAVGLKDTAQRGGWNQAAPPEYALPTETWRELIARRQRYVEVRGKLAAGEVQSVNNLITLNLDSERFVRDVIVNSEGPELVRAMWISLTRISVLDPACGSGAFLFAALNILEPLYSATMQAMQDFLADMSTSQRQRPPRALQDFRRILEEAGRHRNERYYVLKSIIVNNLYGVDIMEEAVEICRLRLFLKLAAQLESYDQIEPLPDIDFNIQAGNTLVGFTSAAAVRRAMEMGLNGQSRMLSSEDNQRLADIEHAAREVARKYGIFRSTQTQFEMDHSQIATYKEELQTGLDVLRVELTALLAQRYGVDANAKGSNAFARWKESHQPFHWFVEFYEIMSQGGFDVVVGNPPYVSRKKVPYTLVGLVTDLFPDIYGHFVSQAMAITRDFGRSSMILPMSITFSQDFASLRQNVCDWGNCWFSSFDNIPASLFNGVSQRCTIWIGHNAEDQTFVAPMHRWRTAYRPSLLYNLAYTYLEDTNVSVFGLPKLQSSAQQSILLTLTSPQVDKRRSVLPLNRKPNAQIKYSQAARNFVSVFRENPPCLDANSLESVPASKIGTLGLSTEGDSFAALASLSGELAFWYWLVRGDGFDVTAWLVHDYLSVLDYLPEENYKRLVDLGRILDMERNRWLVFKKNAGKFVGNFNHGGAYQITRRADLLVMEGLAQGKVQAIEIFEYVQRVLGINEYAGEKGIPADVKNLFPVLENSLESRDNVYASTDALLKNKYGLTPKELDSIINYGIKYRMGRS